MEQYLSSFFPSVGPEHPQLYFIPSEPTFLIQGSAYPVSINWADRAAWVPPENVAGSPSIGVAALSSEARINVWVPEDQPVCLWVEFWDRGRQPFTFNAKGPYSDWTLDYAMFARTDTGQWLAAQFALPREGPGLYVLGVFSFQEHLWIRRIAATPTPSGTDQCTGVAGD